MEQYTEDEKKRIYADCLTGQDCRRARRAYERQQKKKKATARDNSVKCAERAE